MGGYFACAYQLIGMLYFNIPINRDFLFFLSPLPLPPNIVDLIGFYYEKGFTDSLYGYHFFGDRY